MAENERFGREPIQVVEIDQDFCTREWGVPSSGCNASATFNLVKNSTALTDESKFVRFAGQYISDGGFGPDGISEALEIVNDGTNADVGVDVAKSNAEQVDVTESSVYCAWSFKVVSGEPAVRIWFALYEGSATQATLIESTSVNLLTRTATGAPPDKLVEIQDEGDGWFRVYVINKNIVNSASILPDETLTTAVSALTTSTGTYLLSSPQVGSGAETTKYIATSGSALRFTGTQPCFNTRSTCQDPANYDKGVQVLRFVDKRSPLPKDDYYIPSLTGVNVTPAKLNPGGADRNARALGQRASLSVRFLDHPHNDRLVDPYRSERDYNPVDRGTFWTKWRARNPYYMQRPMRLRSGYLKDGAIVDEITREFVITGFSGPDSNGNVTVSGKDVLTLAEDEKAQAPIASRGKLSAPLTAGATSFTLTPSGIGNSEYPASGWVRIGKEVASFTRSGDAMTITRGQFGTEVKSHDEGDSVQLCLRYEAVAPEDILYDLLLSYANIPAQYLDKAQWDVEAEKYLTRLYTAIITEPVGVSKLISEMCQQMYFTIWWDERIGKVIMKAVRLAQEDEVFELDDNRHLIADSISWKDLSDELITQVWVYYGQLDPTEKLDQGSNYAAVSITADPDAEGPDKHNLRRIKTIFSRWISSISAAAAENLGQRILNRYGNAPRQVTFRVDAKDDYLWLGNYIRMTNRLKVNQFGLQAPVNLQIFEAEESRLGSEYKFTAQEFIPSLISDQVEDPTVRYIYFTSDTLNVNLRQAHDVQYGAPSAGDTITFVIREGVTIGGDAAGGGVNVAAGARVTANDFYDAGNSFSRGQPVGQVPILQRASIASARDITGGSTYTYRDSVTTTADYLVRECPLSTAMATGAWPSGVTLNLLVEAGGRIIGEGGNGSAHLELITAGDGGDAIQIDHPVTITNGGIIGGGGGGGSVSGTPNTLPSGVIATDGVFVVVPGGGGQGFRPSQTRGVSIYDPGAWAISPINSQAAAGSVSSPGSGGSSAFRLRPVGPSTSSETRDYRSGSGGSLAQQGGYASVGGALLSSLRYVGLPGKAIRAGANLITWVNKGDVRGQEVS